MGFLKAAKRALADEHFWKHVKHASDEARHLREEHKKRVESVRASIAAEKEEEARKKEAVSKMRTLVKRYAILKARLSKRLSALKKAEALEKGAKLKEPESEKKAEKQKAADAEEKKEKKIEKAEMDVSSAEQKLVFAVAHHKKKALLLAHLKRALEKGELVLKKEEKKSA